MKGQSGSMFKRVLKFAGVALLASSAVLGALYLANRTYVDRYFRMAVSQAMGKSQEAEWYEPVEAVPGAPDRPLDLAAPAGRVVAEDAMAEAAAYADAMDSQGFLVWQGGQLQHASYYDGFDRSRLIASKSMGKMIAGMAVGRAVELGHIDSIDQPMADYITEWKGTDKARPTIRDFLQNSSGISRFDYSNNWPWSQTMREYLSERHEDILIDETVYEYEPGTEYDYSMITSDMLAILLERATGQRYAEFVGSELLKPIGAPGGTVYINRPGGLAHSGCCMMLPAESFIRLGVLLAHDGDWDGRRILPDGWVAQTVTPSPANPHWGLHMWIGQPHIERLRYFGGRAPERGTLQSEPYLADDLFFFDGSGNQAMWIVPSLDLVILRFGPTPKPAQGEWDNSVLPNTIIRGLGAEPAPGATS